MRSIAFMMALWTRTFTISLRYHASPLTLSLGEASDAAVSAQAATVSADITFPASIASAFFALIGLGATTPMAMRKSSQRNSSSPKWASISDAGAVPHSMSLHLRSLLFTVTLAAIPI